MFYKETRDVVTQQQVFVLRCDAPRCTNAVDIEKTRVGPDGIEPVTPVNWYSVTDGIESQPFAFCCSMACIQDWALSQQPRSSRRSAVTLADAVPVAAD